MSDTGDARLVRITGRVQGVGYRAWLAGRARDAGLSGWVRNRRDGSVEALIGGPTDAIDALIAECWRGPSMARVVDVVSDMAERPDEAGFHQRPTE